MSLRVLDGDDFWECLIFPWCLTVEVDALESLGTLNQIAPFWSHVTH